MPEIIPPKFEIFSSDLLPDTGLGRSVQYILKFEDGRRDGEAITRFKPFLRLSNYVLPGKIRPYPILMEEGFNPKDLMCQVIEFRPHKYEPFKEFDEPQGKGVGTKLLKRLIHDAEKEQAKGIYGTTKAVKMERLLEFHGLFIREWVSSFSPPSGAGTLNNLSLRVYVKGIGTKIGEVVI